MGEAEDPVEGSDRVLDLPANEFIRERMRQPEYPVLRDIVLVGGGHSHVSVLKRFGMDPVPGIRLTLVCRNTHTPYSGMLPGYISGHYCYDDVHIDLSRLAVFAGARLFRDEVVGIDRKAEQVCCRQRPSVPYDLLSINIGSTPKIRDVAGAEDHVIPVKPIDHFDARWRALLGRIRSASDRVRIAVVGAGAGGVELTLAMQHRLRGELRSRGRDPGDLKLDLFTDADHILPTHNARVRRCLEATLRARGVVVHYDARVERIRPGQLQVAGGKVFEVDEVIWVTQAGGAPWLLETGLDLDDNGFIRVADTLQTVTDPKIFAAGDIATMVNHPRPKSGVFAVRQGGPLADNLRRAAQGRSLKEFRPQKDWLALVSTGDKRAVASRGTIGVAGRWVWRWKDLIDRRFMRRFSDLPRMEESVRAKRPAVRLEGEEAQQAIAAVAMRCGGCGAKVGASTVINALGALEPVARDDIVVGLNAPDDAAVVRVPPGKAMVHTVDFFRTFIDDPYLFGQIAANHALSDIFAMGAEAQSATAIATVPAGLERKTEATVSEIMTGAVEVLNEAGCALVGGHTGEGRELALGFAINGLVGDEGESILRKGGVRPGDVLVLTKPLGTGTLLAAYSTLDAKGRWIDRAIESMRQSNRQGAKCLQEFGAIACTDVTGFGLLGHLIEMTRPSGVGAEIELSALPVLPGAEETIAAGVLSSLQPANIRLHRTIYNQLEMAAHARYPLIFDPQTAGGLLAAVPAERAGACLEALQGLGYVHAAAVGRALRQREPTESIVLKP